MTGSSSGHQLPFTILWLIALIMVQCLMARGQVMPELSLEKGFKPKVYQNGFLIKDLFLVKKLYRQADNHEAYQLFEKYESYRKASLPMALSGGLILGIEIGDLVAGNRLNPTWVTIGVVLGLGSLISKNASNRYLYQSVDLYNRQQGHLSSIHRTDHPSQLVWYFPLNFRFR